MRVRGLAAERSNGRRIQWQGQRQIRNTSSQLLIKLLQSDGCRGRLIRIAEFLFALDGSNAASRRLRDIEGGRVLHGNGGFFARVNHHSGVVGKSMSICLPVASIGRLPLSWAMTSHVVANE
jgi:hypothetical protein